MCIRDRGLTLVRLGDFALVVGAGMIGTLALQALKLAGCAQVIVADVDAGRLKMALDLGATAVINPKEGDVAEFVRGRTSGRGADVAVEAVGATEPIQTAIAALRKGGALTLVGNIAPKIELPLQMCIRDSPSERERASRRCAPCLPFPVPSPR